MNILNKLTIKHLKMNKKRTIVTIIGVILSTALMVGIGLLFSTIRDNTIKEIINNNGSQHVIINMDYDKLNLIKNNNKVKSYNYIYPLGYAKIEELNDSRNPYIEVVTASDNYFSNLKLVEGTIPQNDSEIVLPKHLFNEKVDIKVGDIITLKVGTRYLNGQIQTFKDSYDFEETLENISTKEYKVVGIIERDITESYSDPAYMAFTKSKVEGNNFAKVLVNYKNPRNTYKVSSDIAKSLGYENLCERVSNECYEDVEYNDSLLSLSGASRYSNILSGMAGVITIILTLVSIACIIVIYNSFAISVMERKKQFGLFSSIGATRKQLAKTVFFEAFIVALIGIPLGILSGIVGIGTVLIIINKLLPNLFSYPLALSIYPLFMIIPVIFMIITIFVSAYIPSKIASRVSPITAIRQNDDIKIKNSKLKTPKFISKIFGVEGELALKNMKRNKKKYRVTIISLFISIVLFISFSAFTEYGLDTAVDMTNIPDYDIQVYSYSLDATKILDKDQYLNLIKEALNHEEVKEAITVSRISDLYVKKQDDDFYTKPNVKEITLDEVQGGDTSFENGYLNTFITILSNEDYQKYKKEIGLKEDRVIIVNKNEYISYNDGKRKKMKDIPYSGKNVDLQLYKVTESHYEEDGWKWGTIEVGLPLNNLYYTDKLPKFIDLNSSGYNVSIIISEDLAIKYEIDTPLYYSNEFSTFIKAPKYGKVWPLLEKIVENTKDDDNVRLYAYNEKEDLKLITNIVIVVKILLYGFISLVTLIGVTSVFNTINTSINLRRKEFSMLRSIGLTPNGFNKILYFESLFFGLKSLLYGIPVSLIVILLLHNSFGTINSFKQVLIPWKSILIAIVGVFVIVLISMMYASSKIKKENILEALREENI